LFQRGSYVPITASGERADHVCAFARQSNGQRAVVVVPRLVANLTGSEGSIDWRDTSVRLPSGHYRCLLSGTSVDASAPAFVGQLLGALPVALLVSA
jgi:(1->4)-alpha-D-glucan 1-alpha-D-glucosylmutase